MVMALTECIYCGDFFEKSPRHKNQTACKKRECQRAKKAAWQRFKMKTDPDYRANQKSSQKRWIMKNSDYWKRYRKKNPKKAERNRILQSIRNKKAPCSKKVMDSSTLIAKMDASIPDKFEILGQFWMIPVIAKMDASKVSIVKIPVCYP
jgi:hypothetical protein